MVRIMPQLTTEIFPFSTPIFEFKLDEINELNENLISDSMNWKNEGESINASNSGNSWHSPRTLFQRQENSFITLCENIINIAVFVAARLNNDFDKNKYNIQANGWVNINEKSGLNSLHRHNDFHLSGCYYVQHPKNYQGNEGAIEFINTRNDAAIYNVLKSNAFAEKLKFKPEVGTMLVFPATLPHFVYPHSSKDERISIAWNVRFADKPTSI